MLLKRINKIDIDTKQSLWDYNQLGLISFESFDERFKYPIIINDFKRIKAYFRILKKNHYFAEYVYSLELLKKEIENINESIFENNLVEYYDSYLSDFDSIKNKNLINDYLINFIVRYNDICVKKRFNEIVEYQKKLNLEYFKTKIPKPKERQESLNKILEVINNEIEFGAGKNIIFSNFDLHHYSFRLFLLTLEEKKDIFEKEILLIQSKLKIKGSIQAEPQPIDLSETKAIDKILYLHKLGVIDFLKGQQPFNTSVNSLASVLSAITGEKSGTLQPMLNPMLSKKVDDKNNPLNSKIAVSRVEKQLINIGFTLNETN